MVSSWPPCLAPTPTLPSILCQVLLKWTGPSSDLRYSPKLLNHLTSFLKSGSHFYTQWYLVPSSHSFSRTSSSISSFPICWEPFPHLPLRDSSSSLRSQNKVTSLGHPSIQLPPPPFPYKLSLHTLCIAFLSNHLFNSSWNFLLENGL